MCEYPSKSERFWDRSVKRFNDREDTKDSIRAALLDHTRTYLQRNDVVLDFGCAAGRYSLEIAPVVKEVWGIDISTEMILSAEGNAESGDYANVRFLKADIFDPSLQAETFNIVLAFNILHLVSDPIQTLKRIKHLLRPGGILLSVTPCLRTGGSLQGLMIKCGSLVGIVPKVHAFTPNDLEELFRKEEFDQIESDIIPNHISIVFIAAKKM